MGWLELVMICCFYLNRASGDVLNQAYNGPLGWSSNYVKYELYFGLSIQLPNGTNTTISVGEFQHFLDNYITPIFPDGLTWYPVKGQWFGQRQGLIKEESIVVIIYAEYNIESYNNITHIANQYCLLYDQEAVLSGITASQVCFVGPDSMCISKGTSLYSDGTILACLVVSTISILFSCVNSSYLCVKFRSRSSTLTDDTNSPLLKSNM
eukprot:TRINITY_DN11189_c0_g1_i1.p1 TRINITY_DN11189_c0_g1~~TRINITY_DN11189_c0_g1_i1.p1  ORF type:complete len:209 (-),score=12.55 TRINITY_DN11189_c0_g1_i1:33-659(-)